MIRDFISNFVHKIRKNVVLSPIKYVEKLTKGKPK